MKETYAQRHTSATAIDQPFEEVVRSVVDEEGQERLMYVLANQYSNPEMAILREYAANALDSHVSAKVDRPIEITLPVYNDDLLIVRDFGLGMSAEDVRRTYSRYGASSKRSSNTLIGGFGLGAKAALAISNTFDFTAVKDGVKTEWNVTRPERQAAQYRLVSTETTSDGNGVEIRIPISRHTRLNADEIMSVFFLAWKKNTVLINGKPPLLSLYDDTQFYSLGDASNVDAWVKLQENSDTPYRRYVYAAVGGVSYRINSSELSYETRALASLLESFKNDVYVNLPIGSVEFTPSREEFIYNDATNTAIGNALEIAKTLISQKMQQELDTQNSRAEALRFVSNLRHANYWEKTFVYRGEKISERIHTPAHFTAMLSYGENDSYSRKAKPREYSSHSGGTTSVFLPKNSKRLHVITEKTKRSETSLKSAVASFQREDTNRYASIVFVEKEYADQEEFAWFMAQATDIVSETKFFEIVKQARLAERSRRATKTKEAVKLPVISMAGSNSGYYEYLSIEEIEKEAGEGKVAFLLPGNNLISNQNRPNPSSSRRTFWMYAEAAQKLKTLLNDYVVVVPTTRSQTKLLEKHYADAPDGDAIIQELILQEQEKSRKELSLEEKQALAVASGLLSSHVSGKIQAVLGYFHLENEYLFENITKIENENIRKYIHLLHDAPKIIEKVNKTLRFSNYLSLIEKDVIEETVKIMHVFESLLLVPKGYTPRYFTTEDRQAVADQIILYSNMICPK